LAVHKSLSPSTIKHNSEEANSGKSFFLLATTNGLFQNDFMTSSPVLPELVQRDLDWRDRFPGSQEYRICTKNRQQVEHKQSFSYPLQMKKPHQKPKLPLQKIHQHNQNYLLKGVFSTINCRQSTLASGDGYKVFHSSYARPAIWD